MWGDKDELRRLSWEESAMQGHSALQSVDPIRIPPRQVHRTLSSSKIQGYWGIFEVSDGLDHVCGTTHWQICPREQIVPRNTDLRCPLPNSIFSGKFSFSSEEIETESLFSVPHTLSCFRVEVINKGHLVCLPLYVTNVSLDWLLTPPLACVTLVANGYSVISFWGKFVLSHHHSRNETNMKSGGICPRKLGRSGCRASLLPWP